MELEAADIETAILQVNFIYIVLFTIFMVTKLLYKKYILIIRLYIHISSEESGGNFGHVAYPWSLNHVGVAWPEL